MRVPLITGYATMPCVTSAWRSWVAVGTITVGLGIGAAGCSTSPSAAAANALCGSVPGPAPPPSALQAIKTQAVKDGGHTGSAKLNHAATNFLTAYDQRNNAAIPTTEGRIIATCKALGISLGAPSPP